MEKAKKIEAYRDKYFSTVVYEYRGYKYEVEYSNGWMCCCSPAWVQHKDEQSKIDNMIDNPKTTNKNEKSFVEQLDECWEMLGW